MYTFSKIQSLEDRMAKAIYRLVCQDKPLKPVLYRWKSFWKRKGLPRLMLRFFPEYKE